MPRPTSRTTVLAVALAAAAAVLGPSPRASASPVPQPALAWASCGDGFECATAAVPLDHDHPHGASITLSLVRLPSTDPAHRIGSLFVNPGGPGNSGVDAVRADARSAYSAEVRARFDIVGVDPRGVARSTPLRCFDSSEEQQEASAGTPAFPVGSAEQAAFKASARQLGEACGRHAPELLGHLSTANSARDLDLLRQAVGDDRLSFVGESYGSFLGQTYAALFPGRVRAMVLDGVVDPVAWSTGSSHQKGHRVPFSGRLGSAEGTLDTMNFFLDQCAAAGPGACAFAAGPQTPAKLEVLFDRLRVKPVDLGGQLLTYAALVDALRGALEFPPIWPDVAGLLQATYELSSAGPAPAARRAVTAEAARDLQRLGRAGARLQGTGTEDETYDNSHEALLGTACADSDNPRNPARWDAAAEAADAGTPHWGADWVYVSQACAYWPAVDKDRFTGPYGRAGSPPPLLISARHDSATPYARAQQVAATIPGARLLTLEGAAHPAAVTGNPCIGAAVTAYLLVGALPAVGATCTEPAPFG